MDDNAAANEIRRLLTSKRRRSLDVQAEDLLDAADGDPDIFHSALQQVLKAAQDLVVPLHECMAMSVISEDIDHLVDSNHDCAAIGDFISLAVDDCNAYLVSCGDSDEAADTTGKQVRIDLYSGASEPAKGKVTVEFLSNNAGYVAFDSIYFDTHDLPLLLLSIAVMPAVGSVEFNHAKIEHVKVGPMFRYHPERMQVSRKYLKKAIDINVAGRSKSVTDPLATMNKLAELITEEVNSTLRDFSILEKGPARGPEAMFVEFDLAQLYLLFVDTGRQIFDMPPRLVDMLAHSDSDDLQLSQLKTPYAMQYIHVGARPGIELAPGWLFDGAYVVSSENACRVQLTASPPHADLLRRWVYRAEPTFEFVFEEEDFSLDLGTAVDVSVARWLAQLDEEAKKAPLRQVETDDFAMSMGLAPGTIGVSTVDRVERQRAEILSLKDVAHQALTIVVNALCYLTAYPEDIERTWQHEAPEHLIELMSSGQTPGARRRAEQTLNAQGYGIVHLCGMQFRHDMELQSDLDSHGSMRTHWRRGHFRNQAYGPQRSLRRLVWIMPILVKSDALKPGDDLPGRVYRVSGPSSEDHPSPLG